MARGLLALILVVALIIETQCRKETKCDLDAYEIGDECCKKCQRGFVKNISCPKDIRKHCVPCENRKEYIDHVNQVDKCLRCNSCDSVFGLEVAENCTPTQNTKCTCAKNHFCNSSLSCSSHCNPCTICESGIIEKQCTSTSDTVCGAKEAGVDNRWIIALIIVLLLLVVLAGAIFWYKRKQKGHSSKGNLVEVVAKQEASYESVPLIYPDVDLSSHVASIVEEMTLQDIKTFVRNHKVPEPVIDQTVRDYCNDTSEQKIKLFQVWYQRHGLKGAYGTLISSLREFKMCTAADKIEQKLKAAVSTCQEGGHSYNDDTEQSKTCTQESRNYYNDSAELSKTCSGVLEET